MLYLAFAIGLGAFGTHSLKGHLSARSLETFGTAHEYHVMAAVVLVLLGLMQGVWIAARLLGPSLLFFVGSLVFSGSLYMLAVTGIKGLGAITPIGGAMMIASTVWVSAALFRCFLNSAGPLEQG